MFIFYAQCGKLVRTPAVHNLTCMYIHTYVHTYIHSPGIALSSEYLGQRGDPGGSYSCQIPSFHSCARRPGCTISLTPPPRFLLSPSNATASLLAILLPQPCALLLENRRFQKLTCPHQHATGDNNSRGTSRRAPRRTSRRVPARASRRAPLHAGALTWLLFCGFLAGGAQNESSPSTMACDSANTARAPVN